MCLRRGLPRLCQVGFTVLISRLSNCSQCHCLAYRDLLIFGIKLFNFSSQVMSGTDLANGSERFALLLRLTDICACLLERLCYAPCCVHSTESVVHSCRVSQWKFTPQLLTCSWLGEMRSVE